MIINVIVRYLTLLGMLAIVAWFFWNPDGWIFKWDPIVVFIFAFAGFIASDFFSYKKSKHVKSSIYQYDIELFGKFIELLPSEKTIDFLQHHDFLASFNANILNPLLTFAHDWDNAEHEFLDRDLENLRLNFFRVVHQFNGYIAQYTSPNAMGFQSVKADQIGYDEAYGLRIRSEANIINNAADEVVEAHQKLVRCGRNKVDEVHGGKQLY